VEVTNVYTLRIPVTESSQVGEVRRSAVGMAEQAGLDATAQGKLAIVASEAATNLVRHSQGGEVLLHSYHNGSGTLVELLALDKGPGIKDLGRSMRDGVSSGSTPGTGLGAIRRLSSMFDVYSAPGIGTALLSRFFTGHQRNTGVTHGVISVPKLGEEVCGDAFAVETSENRAIIIVADGLGHGTDAAVAAQEARRSLLRNPNLRPVAILERAHGALRSTRGAAVAVAQIDLDARVVRYAGIGNISAVILSPEGERRLVSHNGIVGRELRKVQEFQYTWPEHATLVMHSDGLGSHWHLDQYPGLIVRDPSLISGVLYRDFNRDLRDDVTVLVARDFAA
jgi:anti-sigma regulatory factor (Ser/Thr protein kinase)